jgi:hypothetical protein
MFYDPIKGDVMICDWLEGRLDGMCATAVTTTRARLCKSM